MARLCWKELKKKDRRGKVERVGKGKKEVFLKKRRVELEEIEKGRGEGDWLSEGG